MYIQLDVVGSIWLQIASIPLTWVALKKGISLVLVFGKTLIGCDVQECRYTFICTTTSDFVQAGDTSVPSPRNSFILITQNNIGSNYQEHDYDDVEKKSPIRTDQNQSMFCWMQAPRMYHLPGGMMHDIYLLHILGLMWVSSLTQLCPPVIMFSEGNKLCLVFESCTDSYIWYKFFQIRDRKLSSSIIIFIIR